MTDLTRAAGDVRPTLITYPFPLRGGLQVKITLPEDLTEREARRIAAFVVTLVSDPADNEEGDRG